MTDSKKNSQRSLGVHVGSSLILVTFVLICLVAFAALSYSSALSDYRLSMQTSERNQERNQAFTNAEYKLQALNHELQCLSSTTSSATEYYNEVNAYCKTQNFLQYTEKNNLPTVSFMEEINEQEVLSVSVQLLSPDPNADCLYVIQAYQTEITTTFTDTPSLFDFNS